MRKSIKKAVMNRLQYSIGHLEGVKRMVKFDVDPIAILQQTRAISSQLKSIDTLLLSSHFQDQTKEALDSSTKRRLNRALQKLVEMMRHA